MKRILVALDHSPRSAIVLARAAAVAQGVGAELFLLRVVGIPPELPPDAFRSSPGEIVERLRADAVSDLEKMALTLDPSLVAHVLVRIGAPAPAIGEAAREHDVDLVVIGSHGYDALDRVLGTTAAKVVNHSDRSVLVVREPRRA